MGLDMFLDKNIWISKYDEDTKKLKITGMKEIDRSKVKVITQEAIYWRKANAIHNWFIVNVQDGDDDCKKYDVSKEQLETLYNLVCEVLDSTELVEGEITNGYEYKNDKRVPIIEKGKLLKNTSKAKELLPTKSGFFFGGTDYDEGYWEDLKQTRDELKKILEEDEEDNGKFIPRLSYVYHSSW